MNKLLGALSIATLLHTPSHAFISMNEAKMLDILVAKKGMTRLSVVGDSIKNIFLFPSLVGNTDLSEIVQLNKTGHVLLLLEEEKRPFQVTILTRRGRIQDLTIIPSSRSPEPVLLKPALSAHEQEKLQMTKKQNFENKMKAILSGIIPQELRRIQHEGSKLKTWNSVKGVRVASFEDGSAFYDVYFIENTSSQPMTLTPSHFLFGSIEAVSFEKENLESQKTTYLVLLRSKSSKKLFSQSSERT